MLLYIVGPPGAGKTTLAMALAASHPELQTLSVDQYLYRNPPINNKTIVAKSTEGWKLVHAQSKKLGGWVIETAFSCLFQKYCWVPGKAIAKPRLIIRLDAPVDFLLKRSAHREVQVVDSEITVDRTKRPWGREEFWKYTIELSKKNTLKLASDAVFRVDMLKPGELFALVNHLYELRQVQG